MITARSEPARMVRALATALEELAGGRTDVSVTSRGRTLRTEPEIRAEVKFWVGELDRLALPYHPRTRVRFLADVSYGGVDYGPSHPRQVASVREDWAAYFVKRGKAVRVAGEGAR